MIDNYIKVQNHIMRSRKVPHEVFFFDSTSPTSRAEAYEKARQVSNEPEDMAVWQAPGMGRYPGERFGESHPVVDERYAPIAHGVRVVGYAFEPKLTFGP